MALRLMLPNLLKPHWLLSPYLQQPPSQRMVRLQPLRPQAHALSCKLDAVSCKLVIQWIAEYGVTQGRHVLPQLVLAACSGAQLSCCNPVKLRDGV